MSIKTKSILVTGGSGFFGEVLIRELLQKGYKIINVDLEKSTISSPNLNSYQIDIRNSHEFEKIFKKHKFEGVVHLAAMLAHAVKDKNFLWESNVDGTRNVAELCKKYNIKNLVFTSSNCLWAKNFHRKVLETDAPDPVEIYGKSKWEGEKILQNYLNDFNVVIFRCPTIVDQGRLGLLAILFEFMDEGRKVWVLGGGKNHYQFIYAKDLVSAIEKALYVNKSDIFNIGSENVKSFKEVYEYVIKKAAQQSAKANKARVANLNKPLILLAMKVAYFLKMSPLGPYQYKMIAEDFEFDISKIKRELNWKPTLTNEEMLWKSYEYYHSNRKEIYSRKNVSAHKQPAKMGVIRILKWLS